MRGNEMGSSDAHGGGGYGERDFKWVDVYENFAKQMKAAGVDPQHRIAIAVSGGADSMALCQLAVRWKRRSPEIVAGKCDGLFGYVVDHGLRSGSAEEAMRVQQWVSNLGFSCDILKCVWVDGVPALGHLQESARNARYALLAQACQRTGVEILLTAHHADDQVLYSRSPVEDWWTSELADALHLLWKMALHRLGHYWNVFYIGIAGLAGMASAISLYPALSTCAMTKFISCNLLLIRPLLKFVKEDLYAVCQKSGQNWVEDPTNGNLSFARNRIRKALKEVSFMAVRTEIQELIVFCRKMRTILDRDCGRLLSEVAQVSQEWGYVTIKVEKLLSSGVSHAVLHRTVAALMQFAAQKVKPPRGRAVASVVKHLRAKNSKGVFTVGGCNVFPAPGSKGSIIIICFSPDSPPPSALSTVYLDQCPQSSSSDSATSYPRVPVLPHAFPRDPVPDELMADSISKASLLALDIKTPRTAVNEFKGLGLISEAGANLLKELSSTLSLDMCKHPVNQSEEAFTAKGNSTSRECLKIPLSCGGSKHFMDRFVVSLSSRDQERVKQGAQPSVFDIDAKPSPTDCCLMRQKMWIRHFEEKDWVYLLQIADTGTLSLRDNLKADMMPSDIQRQYLGDMDCKAPSTHYTKAHSSSVAARCNVFSSLMASSPSCGVNYSSRELLKVDPCRTLCCKIERLLKAKKATAQLRNVPKLVRRGLPVVITCHGLLLGMPSVGYSHCSLASMKAIFRPGTPLGGAQASWL